MKTKIILGLATLAALALPVIAEDRDHDRDRDRDQRTYYTQTYRYDAYAAHRFDRDDHWRREAQEQRERREQRERIRQHYDFDRNRRYLRIPLKQELRSKSGALLFCTK